MILVNADEMAVAAIEKDVGTLLERIREQHLTKGLSIIIAIRQKGFILDR